MIANSVLVLVGLAAVTVAACGLVGLGAAWVLSAVARARRLRQHPGLKQPCQYCGHYAYPLAYHEKGDCPTT